MTNSQPLPTWLTRATTTHAHKARTATPKTSESTPAATTSRQLESVGTPARGQIRRLDPMDPDGTVSMLVLVIDVDRSHGAAQVVALSEDISMGSGQDALLSTTRTGLSYDLIALFDVTAPAWFVQLGPVLTTLDLDTPGLYGPAGLDIGGPSDPRWMWKQSEHDGLVALTRECTRQVIDGCPDSLLDPSALDLSAVTESEFAAIMRMAEPLLRDGMLCVPSTALRNLTAQRIGTRSAHWNSVKFLLELLPRRRGLILNDTASDAETDLPDAVSGAVGTAIVSMLTRQRSGHRSLRLLTVRSLWAEASSDDAATGQRHIAAMDPEAGVWELYVHGQRHQLIVHAVDGDDDNDMFDIRNRGLHV